MKVAEMREQLYDMIRVADDKKVKAIYTLLENETSEENEWWKDEELLAEFDKEVEEWKSGKKRGFSYSEIKQEMSSIIKNLKA